MRTKLIDPLLSVPRTFLDNGIQPGTPRELRKRILRLNLFLSFGLAVTLTQLIFSYVNQLFHSAMVHLGAVFFLTVGFFLNKDGRLQSAKFTGILTIILHLFAISYLEGIRSGTYFIIFPLLFTLAFVIDVRRSYLEIGLVGISVLATVALIFLTLPYENEWQKIPAELYEGLYQTNLAISLTLTAIFAFIILKTLDNHEQKIMDEKRLSETIYDTSLDAVVIVHVESERIIGCNHRATELFGFRKKEDAIGQDAAEILGAEMSKRIYAFANHPVGETASWYGNTELRRHDQSPFHAYVNTVPFHHNGILYCKTSILDITEIRLAEFETLRAKDKAEKATRVKSRFLSMMSHELRTPLNGIIGTTGLLLQEKYLETQKPQLDILKNASEQMLQLVNDILDFSKLEADKMVFEKKPFQLNAFLKKAAAPFSQSKDRHVPLTVELPPDLDCMIVSDEFRLNQVLNNLLSNARKFTLQGSICLKAECLHRTAENIHVRISVRDTGIGISEKHIRHIFESFTQAEAETTRRFGGTGLGLAISRHIIEQMGGSLEVKSKPGLGSEFYFTLACKLHHNPSSTKSPAPKTLAPLTGLRVLIAEDNPVNLMVAQKFLQKWDVQTDAAQNGIELLQAFHNGSYDLLLVDLDMPEMDGTEALRQIRKTHPDIPVIAFTAAVYDDMENDLSSKGFNDFIPKPFKPEMLHGKILSLTNNLLMELTA